MQDSRHGYTWRYVLQMHWPGVGEGALQRLAMVLFGCERVPHTAKATGAGM